MKEEIIEKIEIVDTSTALMAMDRAQIDTQVATAKQFPRSIDKFKKELTEIACADMETAQSMFYALPRAGKKILGPSVRFAEAVQYSWGNCRAEAKILSIDAKFITALGTCMDLEKNIAVRTEVKRKITDKYGRRYKEDMIVVTGNAACSIAFRNAVFKCIPFSLAKSIYEKAKKTATGDHKSFKDSLNEELTRWESFEVKKEQIFKKLNIKGKADLNVDLLITLIGMRNAIVNGDSTIEQMFAEEKATKEVKKPSDKLKEQDATSKKETA